MSDGNFKWWFTLYEDGEYWDGPYDTRDSAIIAGHDVYGEAEPFYICEADKALYSFTGLFDGDYDDDLAPALMVIDADYVLERWAETDQAINKDGWEEGDFTADDLEALTNALHAAQLTPSPNPDSSRPRADALSMAFQNWAEPRRVKFGAVFVFGKVRNHEKVEGQVTP